MPNLRFWKKEEKPAPRKPLVSVEGRGSQAYLVASTSQNTEAAAETSIRGRLIKAGYISEAILNLDTAIKTPIIMAGGVVYPPDFNDFQDYLDAYSYVPYVARAIDIKQSTIWQMGYDIEAQSESDKNKVNDFLDTIQADTTIREGTLPALLYGNMYWNIKDKDKFKLLDPRRMGLKLSSDKQTVEQYVYSPSFGKKDEYKPEEIIHLRFNAPPGSFFGVSSLQRCLPTVKNILFMEEKLPLIARRRGDPLLEVQIGSVENPVSVESFNTIKGSVINRKPGEDIFHDGTLQIKEVYQSGGIGSRQGVEGIIDHFMRNLVAGLGVPDVALGFGGTSTMATAEYQERLLEAEIRAYQRILKRMHEQSVFPLANPGKNVKLNWRPMKMEDLFALSAKFMAEIEHGVVGPAYARRRLGYPDEAGEGAVIAQNLVASTSVIPQNPLNGERNDQNK